MRVPYVAQSEEADCGPACLAAVLAFHGHHAPVARLAAAAGTDREGTSLAGLRAAAAGVALEAIAVRSPAGPPLTGGTRLPVIALLADHHFVVVGRVNAHEVAVMDPGRGRSTRSMRDFLRDATGVYLTLAPGPGFARGGTPAPGAVRRLWRAAGPLDRGFLVGGAAASFLSGAALVAMALVVRSRQGPQAGPDGLQLLLAALAMVVGLAAWASTAAGSRLVRRTTLPLARAVTERLLTASSRWLEARFLGELAQRPQRLDSAVSTSVTALTSTLAVGASVLAASVALAMVAPTAAALAAVGSAAAAAVLLQGGRRSEVLGRLAADAAAERDGNLLQSLMVMETLRSEAPPDAIRARWTAAQAACDTADDLLGRHLLRRSRIAQALDGATLLAAVVATWAWTHDAVTTTLVPLLVGVVQVAGRAFAESRLAVLTEAQAGWRAVDDALAAPRHHPAAAEDAALPAGTVRCSGLVLGAGRRADALLVVPALRIERGDRVLLTGASGAGKSTLLRVLAGVSSPTAGHVERARHDVAHVPQRPMLLDGSVRDNLLLGRRIDDVALLAALRNLELDGVVHRRGGLDAVVLRGGANFSGGERQRMALARALAGGPDLLLLDEALSAVEEDLADRIWGRLVDAVPTVVAVAHRLPWTDRGERVLHVSGGRLTERHTTAERSA